MKILLVHNFYRSGHPSGESTVLSSEKRMLEARGHEVELFARHSDDIARSGALGVVRAALGTPWNFRATAALRAEARRFAPDVVHVHNSFPMLSPAIFPALAGIAPRVLTLHNYRIFCAAAIPLRGGQACTTCLDRRSAMPALRHGCYRDSRAATLPLAASIALHRARGTWDRDVEAFIALTRFQAETMIAGGLPAAKVHVKPNFAAVGVRAIAWQERARHLLYLGRLSAEKGVRTLIDAWHLLGTAAPTLRIAGSGPLEEELRARAAGLPVEFLGQVTAEQARAEMASARLLVLPSEWFEGFPMVLVEALALGTPIAVSRIGSLTEIAERGRVGIVFEPGDAASLAAVVRSALADDERLRALGQSGLAAFEERYTEEANYTRLMEIYERAIGVDSGR